MAAETPPPPETVNEKTQAPNVADNSPSLKEKKLDTPEGPAVVDAPKDNNGLAPVAFLSLFRYVHS